jgi:hypothetical protein
MTLASGSRVGPYERSSRSARRDGKCTGPGTRGSRDVAIKVLPAELSQDAVG